MVIRTMIAETYSSAPKRMVLQMQRHSQLIEWLVPVDVPGLDASGGALGAEM